MGKWNKTRVITLVVIILFFIGFYQAINYVNRNFENKIKETTLFTDKIRLSVESLSFLLYSREVYFTWIFYKHKEVYGKEF